MAIRELGRELLWKQEVDAGSVEVSIERARVTVYAVPSAAGMHCGFIDFTTRGVIRLWSRKLLSCDYFIAG